MSVLFNRVRVNTATAGTGTMTLGAAVSAAFFTAAEAGIPDGTVVSYVIEDGSNVEMGIGTYTVSGTTLSRTTVTASKIGGTAGTTKLTLSGSAVVFIDSLAADITVPPASSTDHGVARYNGTTGRSIQDSVVTISDTGDVVIPSATDSTGSGTGALVVTGGVGINKALYQSGGFANIGNFNTQGYPAINIAQALAANFSGANVEQNIWNTYLPSIFANTSFRFMQLLTSSSSRDLLFLNNSGNVNVPTNIAATSTITGSFTVAGGAGFAGDMYVGGKIVGTQVINLVQGVDVTMPASTGMYAPDYYEISTGFALEIGVEAVMEIG